MLRRRWAVPARVVLAACGLCGGALLAACGHLDASSRGADAVLASMQSAATFEAVPFDSGMAATAAGCAQTSHPFSTMRCSTGDAFGPVDLSGYGYTEGEFLQSGRAQVYDLGADERAVVGSSGHRYTTRLLVRYPLDAAKFSGRVWVEIYNASSGVDLEDVWRRSWQHLMRSGDAYIGITSKSLTADALKKFDPLRYADIHWQVAGANENGLVWDMLSQLGTQLRQPGSGGLLGTLQPKWIYLAGQSQSGFYLNTYLTAFGDRLDKAGPNGRPLFDGYLNLVGPGAMPLRSEPGVPAVSVPKTLYKATSVPQIVLMSEAESRFYGLGGAGGFPLFPPYVRRADADSAHDKFRFYEVAGAPHSDPTSPVIPLNSEIAKAKADGSGRAPKAYFAGHEESALQLDEFVNAAIENLHAWSAQGTPAPAAQSRWIRYASAPDAQGHLVYTPLQDGVGNTLGGLRSPLIEAPLYQVLSRGKAASGSFAFDWGSMIRLSDTTINTLYGGSCATYLKVFDAAADTLVAERYLVRRDGEQLKAAGRTLAAQSAGGHAPIAWAGQPCR